jgi:hypothetical protein
MAGPMARTVSDLTFAARGMYTIAQEKRDEGYMMRQRVLPIPWRAIELPRKMKIGYFIEEGSVKVCPFASFLSIYGVRMSIYKRMGLTSRQAQLVEEQSKSASTNYEKQDMKLNCSNRPHVRRPCRVKLMNSNRDLQGNSNEPLI